MSHNVKVETQIQLGKLGKFSGAELKNQTEVIAKNLLEKEPDLQARVYIAQMVANMYCSVLRDSKEFTDKEILKELGGLDVRLRRYVNKPDASPNDAKTKSKNIDSDKKSTLSIKTTAKADKHGFALLEEGVDSYFHGRNDDARQSYYSALQLFIQTANTNGQAQTHMFLGDLGKR